MARLVVSIASVPSFFAVGSASPPSANLPLSAPPYSTQVEPQRSAALEGIFDLGSSPRRSLMVRTEAPPPLPPTARQAMADGVLIVVSILSQQAFVFKRGELWDISKVSTGKAGKETPVGEFPILEKQTLHRSTLYNSAPMPFMQRITWGGVALHAGYVPGYPASHGCIRLPKAFAEKLYKITNFSSTVVLVTDEAVTTAQEARKQA